MKTFRMIRYFTSGILLIAVIGITWALNSQLGSIPPLGPLTNPFTGFWQNMESGRIPDLNITADRLNSEVIIRYDERGVPHIFADNDYDLYFAQGYVTARDRLWQIDFQARGAAGRISEIVGPQAIEYDRTQRRMGMLYGAELNAAMMTGDSLSAMILEAYKDGYNFWLKQLPPKAYPVEYKILNIEPEPFTTQHAALVLMSMSQTLTSRTRAHSQSNARALLDEETYNLLYPDELPWVRTMIPEDQAWDFEPLEPSRPDPGFVPQIVRDLPVTQSDPDIGSNSWAVDGSKTANGHPILASDPHLGITLPSTWYEIHLNSDGINTYGVSLPAAPGISIGFNDVLAWGITNGGSNTLDVYEIEFRDEHRNEYRYDGQWKPVTRRIEEIRVRGGETIRDTVRYTHHGPVVNPPGEQVTGERYPKGHAIKWIAFQPGNILKSVYEYNRARNRQEFEKALRQYENLTMNFTYADRDGNISVGHYGKLPVRFHGQGDYISDGRDPAYDWDRYIPFEHLPRSVNPERGYVSTANQAPVTADYPYYLGRFYADFNRNSRIKEILESSDGITTDFFEEMMMDNRAPEAQKGLPFMLERLDRVAFDEPEHTLARLLELWDYNFDAGSPVALFYNRWQQAFRDRLIGPLIHQHDRYITNPDMATIISLLLDGHEDLFPSDVDEALTQSFRTVYEATAQDFGRDPEQWHYGRDRRFSIGHLAMLPGFGRDGLEVGGTRQAINAVSGSFAPSWRMVVELGPEIRARGHYSGGQSGNPGHPDYDRPLDNWADGTLHDLNFWQSVDDEPEKTTSTLTLSPN